jgi:hypothetical protein
MSLSSKPKKIKAKGSFRELKLVNTVSRKGYDTIKTEEVKTPRHPPKNVPSTSQTRQTSSSPNKRRKLELFDDEPISLNLEGVEASGKRRTMVCVYPSMVMAFTDYLKGQNDYLRQFLGYENTYLNHLLNLEIPPTNLSCDSCSSFEARFRCLDCYGRRWLCQGCLIDCHIHHPFHRPQQWKDGSFENVSLCDLGYVFKLGHLSSSRSCPEDDDMFGDRRMTVIHVNGIFEHCVRFCKCLGANSEHLQLFDHRLFSSSFDRPETAFTLDVLEYYGIDSMECKTSAQSFFQKLRRVTNNAFPDDVPVRYNCHLFYSILLLIFNNRTDTTS